jgi:hypothetical protein
MATKPSYYNVKFNSDEECHICKVSNLCYGADRIKFLDDYFEDYPNDVLCGKYIYHTCSVECRAILELCPPVK